MVTGGGSVKGFGRAPEGPCRAGKIGNSVHASGANPGVTKKIPLIAQAYVEMAGGGTLAGYPVPCLECGQYA